METLAFGTLFYLGNHVQSRSFVFEFWFLEWGYWTSKALITLVISFSGTIFQDQETVISIFNAEKSVKDFKALTFLSRGHNAPFSWNDNELNTEFSNVVKLWIKKKKRNETSK
ncbi:XXYS1_4_G0038120.mRNA.1.CDS.1 [Saccharomyces cerevisiae]|nr:XXYS1_4_G0038120.mRNA.1.CDS.1 [Saccharomyces cerevisiae]